MKIDARVSDIRGLLQVGPTSDRKGNPVAVVEILGIPVLYADPRDLPHTDWDTWEEVIGAQLGAFLGEFLLGSGVMEKWGRRASSELEVWRLPNREEYVNDW